MPIRDQGAMERSLDNDYGSTRGPNAPDDLTVHLFHGDPTTPDAYEIPNLTEDDNGDLVPNGYAPAEMSNDDWLPSEGGIKLSDPNPVFAEPLEEWETVTHWAVKDPVTGLWWDSAPLAIELDVTGPGTPVAVQLAIFYDDNLDDDA